jgi:hypothetical protein
MKFSGYLFIFLFCSFSAFGQKNLTLSGLLSDSNNEPVIAGNVELLTEKDSTYVAGIATNLKGEFSLKNLAPARYILKISYIGYLPLVKNIVMAENQPVLNLGKLIMEPDEVLLKDVIIEGKKPEVIVKNDTLEYDAGSYKTQDNAVVEDLLKKLPGVEVDKDGKITAGGNEVKKFLVDGKDFFSNDPTVATKNLPAEMIEKLQVIDRKSDMARMTGFDDGEEETVINLTIRPGMKQGTMGNALAGLGKDIAEDDDLRYQGAAFVNHMRNENRFTLITGLNNNNNMGASDLGVNQFGGMRMRRGGGGITESKLVMFSGNKEFSPALNVNADFRIDNSDRKSVNETERATIAKELSQLDKTQTDNKYFSQNISANFTIEWKPDSLNSLIARPNVTLNSSHSDENENSDRFNYTDLSPIFESQTTAFNEGKGYSFGGSLDYAHKFNSKRGRVFSLGVRGNYNDTQSHENSLWTNNNFKTGIITDQDQRFENDVLANNYRATLSYIEPIGKNNFIQASYRYAYTDTKSINSTFDLYDETPDPNDLVDWAIRNDSLSRSTVRNAVEQRIGLSFKSVRAKYNYTVGFNVDPSNSVNETWQPSHGNGLVLPYDYDSRLANLRGDTLLSSVEQNVVNFSPMLNFNYIFGQRTNLRIDYEGQTNQPSANQLRDYTDQSRPTEITKGNPNLKPGYSNSLRARFNKYVPETQLMYNLNLNGGFSMNDITSVTIMQSDGVRTTTYENINGNWDVTLRGMFNTPLKKKEFSISSFFQTAYSNRNSFVNGDKNNGKNFSASIRPRFNYRTSLFDIGVNPSISYNNAIYSARPENNQKTTTYGIGGNTTWYLPHQWNIDSDINYTARTGFATGYNVPETMWNASISKQIFSKRHGSGSIKLQAYDILQDRKSISANVTTNGYSTQKMTVIPSFFIGSFIYKFSFFPKSSSATERDMRGGERGGWGGGGWGGPPPGGGGGRPF